jgi:hypothetical protein
MCVNTARADPESDHDFHWVLTRSPALDDVPIECSKFYAPQLWSGMYSVVA